MSGIVNADRIGHYTCLGNLDEPTIWDPVDHGACFDLIDERGTAYRVLNFYLENFEFLIQEEVLCFPVKIKAFDDGHAIVEDARVPSHFYRKDRCYICCPREFQVLIEEEL